jgi:hypothetical protein
LASQLLSGDETHGRDLVVSYLSALERPDHFEGVWMDDKRGGPESSPHPPADEGDHQRRTREQPGTERRPD